eukprot:542867_1
MLFKMTLFCSILTCHSLSEVYNSQCGPWIATNPDDGSEVVLDLSCLSSHTTNTTANWTGWGPWANFTTAYYLWSICGNREFCDGENVMMTQTIGAGSDMENCAVVARWNSTEAPQFDSDNGGTWTFLYVNGDEDCGNPRRKLNSRFVCSPGTEYYVDGFGELGQGSCFYQIEVKTQYACIDSTYTCVANNHKGWLNIILVVTSIFVVTIFALMCFKYYKSSQKRIEVANNNYDSITLVEASPNPPYRIM